MRLLVLALVLASTPASADVTALVRAGGRLEKSSQYASAFDAYLRAERELRIASEASSALSRKEVKSHIFALAPRLSSLKIVVPADAQLVVTRDNVPVDREAWNRDMPVDGGEYLIVVRAPGRTPWSTMVRVAPANDRKIVQVPVLVVSRDR